MRWLLEPGGTVSSPPHEVPSRLASWLQAHGAETFVARATEWPGIGGARTYALVSVKLAGLSFKNHTYNPRDPSEGKVNELLASVRQLSLLSPLTCSFVDDPRSETVVLIDGRHRFKALEQLAAEEPDWLSRAWIDLKVYHGLSKSDMHVMATYLNRTRRSLKKGEYYRAIVKIFEEKERELQQATKKPVKESDVFRAIHSRELGNINYDLSIGRLVGMAGFENEDGSWAPYVGIHQGYRFEYKGTSFYCPLTAGNLAELLGNLCRTKAYDDFGEKRAVELGNTIELGRVFREIIFDKVVKSRDEVTKTTVACKFWCIAAFGSLLSETDEMKNPTGGSALSNADLDWEGIETVVSAYGEVMAEQAEVVHEHKDAEPDEKFLNRAWSHQTQRDQVLVPLKKALARAGVKFVEG